MIWIFTRGRAQIDVEIRRAEEAYELVVSYPDGTEHVERFGDPARLIDRSLRLQRRLMRDRWEPRRPAIFAPPPAGLGGAPAGCDGRARPPAVRSSRTAGRLRPRRLLAGLRRHLARLGAALHL
ncbi:MAG TPA: hypothetical protein VNI83_07620 [Vicinamibacterales bacterium]|nr:hypothetical protein [Vicinamibacterales bacterium]